MRRKDERRKGGKEEGARAWAVAGRARYDLSRASSSDVNCSSVSPTASYAASCARSGCFGGGLQAFAMPREGRRVAGQKQDS